MVVLRKCKLGTKIALGFSTVIILLVLTILFGYFGLKNISQDFSQYRDIAKNDILAGEIQANLLENQIAFKDFITLGDDTSQHEFEKRFQQMEGLINEAKNSITDIERSSKINLVFQNAKEYKKGFEDITKYQNEQNQFIDILSKKGPKLEENLSELINMSFDIKDQQALYSLGETQKQLLLSRLNVSRYLEDNDVNFVNIVMEEFSEMDKWIEHLKRELQDKERSKILDSIIEDKNTYVNNFIEAVSTIESRNEIIDNLNIIGPEIAKYIEDIKISITDQQKNLGQGVKKTSDITIYIMVILTFIAITFSIIVSISIIRIVVIPVKTVTDTFKGVSEGEADLNVRLKVNSSDEIGQMANYFNKFVEKLQGIMSEIEEQNWIKTGQSELNEKIRGEQDSTTLASNIITYITKFLNGQVGAIYFETDDDAFKLIGSYAYKKRKNIFNEIKVGEGLVGQAALEKQTIVITNVPNDYITINSGVGEAVPNNIVVIPCLYNNKVKGIIEIGSFNEFTDIQLAFLEEISEIIAISINSEEARSKMTELLERSMKQTEELQLQQEELRQMNEELEEQTKALKESEAHLQIQQEELRSTNEELEERTKSLEKQKYEINKKNEHLEIVQKEIEEKAAELGVANKYKSEFLANMSHELRTPLNSILILSKLLSEKEDSTLFTEKELEFARTIHSSGADLLNLINDILDLSKVEAGKMDINLENMNLSELMYDIERSFKQIAVDKELNFSVNISDNLPESIYTDVQRVKQIVKNLLSNAFKFTEQGAVTVQITRPAQEECFNSTMNYKSSIKISVTDTGIGIAKDKQKVIFEAFKQSDGTISRKYGGTGLGLSISKELAQLLGGNISINSEEGKGSTFSIILPEKLSLGNEDEVKSIKRYDKKENFNERVKEIEIVPNQNSELIKEEKDIYIQANDIDEKVFKKLLIVEDNKHQRFSITELIESNGILTKAVDTGEETYRLLKSESFDCMILDLGLKDMSGFDLLKKLKNEKLLNIPVVIYTGKELSREEEAELQKYTDTIIIKGTQSMERLMDEVTLFLNSLDSKGEIIKTNYKKETTLNDKKVLIIDDDMRNVFAITSILEENNIKVFVGRNGRHGIEKLTENPDIDLILMDIMMPEMDGYTAMKEIRKKEEYNKVPIIALTAKAMKEDRNKCINAGANDYLTKPVDVEKLISLLRVWLY